MCHRLVSIYSKDQTEGIQQLAGELSGRYSCLTSSCTARAKSLQAALESLNMFNREVAEFLAWLGELETSLERLDGQVEGLAGRDEGQGQAVLLWSFFKEKFHTFPHELPPSCNSTKMCNHSS